MEFHKARFAKLAGIKEELLTEGADSAELSGIAADYLDALQQTGRGQRWMRYSRTKISQYPSGTNISAMHGFIPREHRHQDSDDFSDYEGSERQQEYYAWEDATSDVIERFLVVMFILI